MGMGIEVSEPSLEKNSTLPGMVLDHVLDWKRQEGIIKYANQGRQRVLPQTVAHLLYKFCFLNTSKGYFLPHK